MELTDQEVCSTITEVSVGGTDTENPDEFISERFLNNEIAKIAFIPFGGGTRICSGKNMSNVQIKTLLILLLRKYDVELVDSEKPNFKYSFFLSVH
ncbi:cytochrome P450 [Rhizophagus irregularis]|uniref:Cytochrome P450 n=1 Tax=Rhizophagus irregularis TaxID=588596 RepID=A0A2I1HDW6_9GLOM|nr:cytochrome P450 [Rhizophagus irregularis]